MGIQTKKNIQCIETGTGKILFVFVLQKSPNSELPLEILPGEKKKKKIMFILSRETNWHQVLLLLLLFQFVIVAVVVVVV